MRVNQHFNIIILTASISVFLISACGTPTTSTGKIKQYAEKKVVEANKPKINYFGVDFSEVLAGDNTTLKWNVSRANSIKINNGIGEVGAIGTKLLVPASDITYTLTASNEFDTVTMTAAVRVTDKVLPPTIIFVASPDTAVASGDKVMLGWEVYGAREISIDNGTKVIVLTEPKGTVTVTPTATTTYTITASYGESVSTKSLTVEVSPAGN
jgi:hypothetical protein